MKHKLLRRLGALALALVLALSMAVTPAWAADPTDIKITLNGKEVTEFSCVVSNRGEPLGCVASDGTEIDALSLRWESSDSTVLAVNGGGYYRGVAAGTAKITISLLSNPDIKATCTVTVRAPVTGITLLPRTEFTMHPTETQELIPQLAPAGAEASLTWSSSNEKVATVKEVNGKGVVTAVGAGTAVITAAVDGVSAPCTIIVETPAVTGISLPSTLTVAVGATEKLEPTLTPAGAEAKVTWTSNNTRCVTVDGDGTVTGVSAGSARITATIKVGNRDVSAYCTVTAQVKTAATSVTLAPTSLRLNPGSGGTAQLRATVLPSNSTDKVTWTSSNPAVATVDENGKVTAVGVGTATITALAGNKSSDPCTVTVGLPPDKFLAEDVRKNLIPNGNVLDLGLKKKGDTQRVLITPDPLSSIFTQEGIQWSVEDADGKASQSVIQVTKDSGASSAVVRTVGPGEAKLVVTLNGVRKGEWTVRVSGITLRGNVKTIQNGQLSLWEGEVETLLADRFGDADNTGNIIWYSSDEAIVAVDSSGRLTARTPGTVKVTASLVGFADAEVTVTVREDTSALVQAGSVTAGGSINLNTIASRLNSISQSKTGAALSYITNLSVDTDRGILHDTHRSEADTGAGVGASDRYYLSANTTLGQSPLSDLSFVAKNTFSGTADISYTGVTTDNRSFSGIIRVTVGAANDVFYTAVVDQPLSFQADDFNRICQSKQGGRSLNYITFTLPQASWGQLYYDYNGPTHPGQAVTSGAQYYRTRTPSLDRVSFVPSSTCPSSVAIAYRGMDANGGAYSGVVTISVTKQNGGSSSSDVRFGGVRGERVAFSASAFSLACYNTISEQLSYVRFGALPASGEGTLYVNYRAPGSYGGVASANTSYYASSTPGLNTLSFVSTSTASSQVAIPYTGYGVRGTVFTGMVYIDLDEVNQTGLRYSVTSGKTVSFSVNDFNSACINATGASLNYVRFSAVPTTTQGYLRYRYTTGSNYGTVSTSTQCYRVNPNSSSSTPLVGNVYFQAGTSYVGTVTLPYTGYNTNGVSFTGEVVIQVTPNTVTYTGTNANPLQIRASDISNACSGLMSRSVDYITLNNLPASDAGRLYVGYTKLGTGTAANTGTRYYVSGSPNISQLSFVPRGRYTGQVEVGYTAVSTSGEQVTGRIIFNIVGATGSGYFRDMGNYVWAASAVDYLYRNGVVNGIGNSSFGPNQYILRRDFILMLSRGFKFPAAGSYSFPDVPINAYYAQAVASAKYLGIVRGSGGYFLPASAITREDAMVMVYNTLIKMGKNPGSGTALLTQFSDQQLVSSYAREAVGALVRMGAVTGSNGRLNPKAPITRAEAAVILHFVLTM